MEIPTPYIFNIETPTLLFGGHLFHLGDETRNDSDYISISEKRFNLEEIANPWVLEDLYFENNKEIFERYKQDFISRSMHQVYLSAESIESELRNNRTLNLIVNEILPVITSVKMDNQLEAVLNDTSYNPKEDIKDIFSTLHNSPGRPRQGNNSELVDKTKDELIKKIESEYSSVGVKKTVKTSLDDVISRELIGGRTDARRGRESYTPSILVDELLGASDMLLVENRVYDLYTVPKILSEFRDKISDRYWADISLVGSDVDPATVAQNVRRNYDQVNSSVLSRIINKLESTKLNIGGNYLLPLYSDEASHIISDYKKLVEKKLKIDSINHASFQADSLRKIEEEKSRLSRLVNADKFELKGAGFEKYGSSYYVFITTPEYVLKSPHNGAYYKFGKAKIGLEISLNGNYVKIEEPHVLNHYFHPFLPGHSSRQKICMGKYNTDQARKLPPGQAVLTILTKAQENLMMGYRTGGNPHNVLDENKFSSFRISEQEFRNSGIVCLNDYGGSRR